MDRVDCGGGAHWTVLVNKLACFSLSFVYSLNNFFHITLRWINVIAFITASKRRNVVIVFVVDRDVNGLVLLSRVVRLRRLWVWGFFIMLGSISAKSHSFRAALPLNPISFFEDCLAWSPFRLNLFFGHLDFLDWRVREKLMLFVVARWGILLRGCCCWSMNWAVVRGWSMHRVVVWGGGAMSRPTRLEEFLRILFTFDWTTNCLSSFLATSSSRIFHQNLWLVDIWVVVEVAVRQVLANTLVLELWVWAYPM